MPPLQAYGEYMEPRLVFFGSNIVRGVKDLMEYDFDIDSTIMWQSPLVFLDEFSEESHKLCNQLLDSGDYIVIDLYLLNKEFVVGGMPVNYFDDASSIHKVLSFLANILKKKYSDNRIILIRTQRAKYKIIDGFHRSNGDNGAFNQKIREYEDYFYSLTSCTMVDLCSYYGSDPEYIFGESSVNYEKYYNFDVALKITNHIASNSSSKIYDSPNVYFKLCRYLEYGNSLDKTYQHGIIFDMSNLVEVFFTRLSLSFIEKYIDVLSKIKSVDDVVGCYEVRLVLSSFNKIRKNSVVSPEEYDIIIKYNLRLLEDLVRILNYDSKNKQKISAYNLHVSLLEKYWFVTRNSFNLCEPDLYDVWGSCISREVVKELSSKFVLQNYIYRNSPLYIDDDVVKELQSHCKDPSNFNGSNFRMRSLSNEVNRNTRAIISKSDSKWIILDLYDLLERTFSDGHSNIIVEYDTLMCPIGKVINDVLFEKPYYWLDDNSVKSRLDTYVQLLSEKYGHRIILIKLCWNSHYIDSKGMIKHFDQKTSDCEQRRMFIDKWEKYVANLLKCNVIDIARHFYSDELFLWGHSPVHYEYGFYLAAAEIIEEIMTEDLSASYYSTYSRNIQIKQIIRIKGNKNPNLSLCRVPLAHELKNISSYSHSFIKDNYPYLIQKIYSMNNEPPFDSKPNNVI